MLDLKVSIAWSDDLVDALGQGTSIVEGTLPTLAMTAGQNVVSYAQYLFRNPKSGRERVSRDGSGRIMTGSAPGESPAVDTGALDKSFTSVLQLYTITVKPNVDYASALEPNRPFMQPAFDHASGLYYQSILDLIKRVI